MSEVEAAPERQLVSRDEARDIAWSKLLEVALTAPGNTFNVYSRFHNYWVMNKALLYAQGASSPVASYKGWQALGRQVRKGEKGYSIVRPINVKVGEDDDGQDVRIRKYKPVNGAFEYTQTDGDELEIPEPAEWSLERALGNLGITQVAYAKIDGNTQGYSYGHNIAISPVAVYPLPTGLHELAHVVHGHTTDDNLAIYEEHRGTFEFQAEGSAYLAGTEIGVMTDEKASVSRRYMQDWLGNERPSDASIRSVFTVADKLVRAGRVALGEYVEL